MSYLSLLYIYNPHFPPVANSLFHQHVKSNDPGLKSFIWIISDPGDPCNPNPCSGTCILDSNSTYGYRCTCSSPMVYGDRCQYSKYYHQIVFIVRRKLKSFLLFQITALTDPAVMKDTAQCHPQPRTIHVAVKQDGVESTALSVREVNKFQVYKFCIFPLVLFRI